MRNNEQILQDVRLPSENLSYFYNSSFNECRIHYGKASEQRQVEPLVGGRLNFSEGVVFSVAARPFTIADDVVIGHFERLFFKNQA